MGKTPISDFVIPTLLLIDGLVCALMAIFAHTVGLDPNAAWGRARYFLLLLGLVLALASAGIIYFNKKEGGFFESIIKSEPIKTIFLFGHLWVFIFAVYAWFITFGNFTTWNHTTRYYTQLADAFGRGQLYVDADPGEALLAAKNPYSTTDRPAFNDEIWDMSLYKGKLYLYWGPVPALLITPIQFFTDAKVTDIYLVYFFFCGLLIFNSLIILKLWRLFFANIPLWNVIPVIIIVGFILPIPWSLNRPEVYQAAIGAGQFFLMGGIYLVILAFEKSPDIKGKALFWAGLFWACSVGSRAMNVLAIVFMVMLIMFWYFNMSKPVNWIRYIQALVPLFIPLAAGAIIIGWYNWARFDSPLEFGLRYQITIHNLNELMGLTFQADYFFPNIYAYVFQPFEFISKFPFIQPLTVAGLFEELGITSPKIYFGGRLTGFLVYAPFLFFAFLPLFTKIRREDNNETDSYRYKFIVSLLAISFIINFLGLLFFFFGQLRYSVDVISQITLLAIIGYWELISKNQKSKSISSKYFAKLANLLVVITISASFLLAFSSETNRMETLNPLLMERINGFFTISK